MLEGQPVCVRQRGRKEFFVVVVTKVFTFVNCVLRLLSVRLSPAFQGLLIFRQCQNSYLHS